jgi:four helix bundle protein
MTETHVADNGIDERTLRFACDVIRFIRTIRYEPGIRRLLEQLVDAAGSIGANRDEATSGSSRKEFIRYNEISLRSAKESVRWLRVCADTGLGSREKCLPLIDEGKQISNILGAIVVNSKRNQKEATANL